MRPPKRRRELLRTATPSMLKMMMLGRPPMAPVPLVAIVGSSAHSRWRLY